MNSEPMIVAFGRGLVGEWTPDEYLASLTSAFVERRSDFVVLDSNPHGQRFLAACAAWAIDQGLLYCSESQWDTGNEDTGQSIISKFRLTEEGRTKLGL